MTRILFVCHGNICRSPMAEFAMKELVKKAGIEDQFQIARRHGGSWRNTELAALEKLPGR